MLLYYCLSLPQHCSAGVTDMHAEYTSHFHNHHCLMHIITLRPRQNVCHFTDDIFKCIFLYENVWISIWISLKFVRRGPINNIPALIQIMAWRRPGDKPLSEPMMVRLPMHLCVTWPQWVIGDQKTCVRLKQVKLKKKNSNESKHFKLPGLSEITVLVHLI